MMNQNFSMIKSIQPHYNITFIGSGRVAHHLAPAFANAGHKIIQVYSRNIENAIVLADMVGAEPICKFDSVNKLSDIYIYCISDDAVQWVMNHIQVHEGLHIHTSGSLSIDIFKKTRVDYGCLYPLQTFSKDKKIDMRKISFFINANNRSNLNKINLLARDITNNVYEVTDEDKRYIHLAAVFANNFTNLMYIKAEKILQDKNIPFKVLGNLIQEGVNKAKKIGPQKEQKNHAIRGDVRIIDQHISMLSNEPEWQEVYTILSDLIKKENT